MAIIHDAWMRPDQPKTGCLSIPVAGGGESVALLPCLRGFLETGQCTIPDAEPGGLSLL